MALTKYRLGDLIQQRREKYDGTEQLPSWGVSKDGFIQPRQDGADTSIYNVYYKNDFVFNPARMELNSIALNQYFDKAICSSLYEVFFIRTNRITISAGASGLLLSFCFAAVSGIMPQKASFPKTFCHKLPDFA